MNAPDRIEDFAPFGEDYGPLLTGPYAPVADESDFSELPLLRGAIPKDLNGVYLRAGPNPRFAPNGRYAGDSGYFATSGVSKPPLTVTETVTACAGREDSGVSLVITVEVWA